MLLIIHGLIKTMAGKEYKDGYVQIRDGKIEAVGAMDELYPHVPTQTGIEVLDARGNLVMPGLIEAHCHMGITEEKKGIEGDDCNESVNPITPEARGIDAINCMDGAFYNAVKAGITSAMIGPGSANVVGGQFVFMKTWGRCIDELIVLQPAAMKIAFGENPKANYGEQEKAPKTRMGIASALRGELLAAVHYLKRKKQALENGGEWEEELPYEAWIPVLEGRIPLKAHAHRVDDIFTAIRIAKEFGLKMTLDHCSEGHLIAEAVKESGYPAIVGPELSARNKIETQNKAFKTAGILEAAGVTVAITTDHPVSLIQSLPICVGLSVKEGLSMEGGYRAMTVAAAEICNVDHRVGSLEVGKDADIAIFSGNPMEVFTRTLCTVIDGKIVYREEGF